MKKLMIAMRINMIKRIFSLFIVIIVSKMFHLGKNPSNGGIPPKLNSRIVKFKLFDLFM